MTKPRSRFEGALVRTLHEVDLAHINGLIMRQLERRDLAVSFELFGYIWMALFNDRIARASRVLDHHSDAHGYWYIIAKKPAAAKASIEHREIGTSGLEDLSDRLKIVRDWTIAHIDRRSAVDPKAVWKKAGITHMHLQVSLMSVRRIVGDIYRRHHGHNFERPEYDRTRARAILEAAKRASEG